MKGDTVYRCRSSDHIDIATERDLRTCSYLGHQKIPRNDSYRQEKTPTENGWGFMLVVEHGTEPASEYEVL